MGRTSGHRRGAGWVRVRERANDVDERPSERSRLGAVVRAAERWGGRAAGGAEPAGCGRASGAAVGRTSGRWSGAGWVRSRERRGDEMDERPSERSPAGRSCERRGDGMDELPVERIRLGQRSREVGGATGGRADSGEDQQTREHRGGEMARADGRAERSRLDQGTRERRREGRSKRPGGRRRGVGWTGHVSGAAREERANGRRGAGWDQPRGPRGDGGERADGGEDQRSREHRGRGEGASADGQAERRPQANGSASSDAKRGRGGDARAAERSRLGPVARSARRGEGRGTGREESAGSTVA